MKKPEKRKIVHSEHHPYTIHDRGYNQACDDWEAWLKSSVGLDEEKMFNILNKATDQIGIELKVWNERYVGKRSEEELTRKLAKAITNLSRKEQ